MLSIPLHQQVIEIRGIDNCEEFDKIIFGEASQTRFKQVTKDNAVIFSHCTVPIWSQKAIQYLSTLSVSCCTVY